MINQDNKGAEAWVGRQKNFLVRQNGKKNPKYLLSDWYSTAGYEASAVIFVVKNLNEARNSTFCQRAKAKLVIYHVPNAPDNDNVMIQENIC